MKKFYFLLLLNAVMTALVYAQNTPDSFANRINYIFQYVDKNQVTTGILADYGIDFLNLANYTGQQLHDSNYVGNKEWISIYTGLYSSQVRVVSSLTRPDSVAAKFNSYNLPNQATGLAILHFNYNSYRDDAVTAGLVTISNDQIHDVPNRPQSPYLNKTAFAVSPTKNTTVAGNDYFVFKPDLVYSNTGLTITSIEADKGNGYFFVSMNTPFSFGFSATGIYNVKFRITFSNSTQLLSRTKIFVKPSSGQQRWADNPNATLSHDRNGSKPYLGVTGLAHVQVHLSSTNTTGQIRKPLIVVEGFDPWQIVFPNDPGANYNSHSFIDEIDRVLPLSGFTYDFHQVLDVTGQYDLIFVDFNNGTDFIQRNAFVVDAVIRWVNTVKTTWNGVRQQNVIMGMSMGGIATRYALRDMENNSINHECRLFISDDAPQNGANVPLGIQMLAQHLGSVSVSAGLPGLYLIPIIPSGLLDPFAQIRDLQRLSETPAARQMLIQRVIYDRYSNINGMYTISKTEQQNFQNEINQLGWPVNVRTIGVSNAICNSTLIFPDNNRRIFTFSGNRSSTYFGQMWQSAVATYAGVFSNLGTYWEFPLSLVSTATSLNVDIWSNAVPPNFVNEQIYNGDVSIKRKILWTINVNTYLTKSRGYSGTTSYALDNSPGGVYDLNEFGFDQAVIQAQLPDFFQNFVNVSVNQTRFSFVPRPSSLNILNPYSNLRTDICSNKLVCENVTTHNGYFVSPTANELHISYNRPNAEYIFGQMEGQIDCSSICAVVTGPDNFCTSGNYTVTGIPAGTNISWSASPSGIVTLAGNNPVTATRSVNGTFSLTANFTGCPNSSATKNSIVAGGFVPANYPISGPSTTCPNSSVYFSAPLLSGATSYNWFWPSGWTYYSGQGTRNLALGAGSNSGVVGLQVANACESNPTPATKFVQVLNCGGGGWGFSASPNPGKGKVNIKTVQTQTQSAEQFSATKIYEVKVYDQSGIIKKQYKYSGGVTTTAINFSELVAGIYLIQAFNGSSWVSQQVIKQ